MHLVRLHSLECQGRGSAVSTGHNGVHLCQVPAGVGACFWCHILRSGPEDQA